MLQSHAPPSTATWHSISELLCLIIKMTSEIERTSPFGYSTVEFERFTRPPRHMNHCSYHSTDHRVQTSRNMWYRNTVSKLRYLRHPPNFDPPGPRQPRVSTFPILIIVGKTPCSLPTKDYSLTVSTTLVRTISIINGNHS
jgi:hypothetical protein